MEDAVRVVGGGGGVFVCCVVRYLMQGRMVERGTGKAVGDRGLGVSVLGRCFSRADMNGMWCESQM